LNLQPFIATWRWLVVSCAIVQAVAVVVFTASLVKAVYFSKFSINSHPDSDSDFGLPLVQQ